MASANACPCIGPQRRNLRARVGLPLSAAAAVMLPKCPLCAAAWLSVLGLGGASVSWLAPALVGLRSIAIVAVCALLARRCWRRGRRGRHGAARLADPITAR